MNTTNIYENDCINVANYLKSISCPFDSVVITGATGMIGSFLVKSLLKYNDLFNKNVKVFALVRNVEKARVVFTSEQFDKITFFTKEFPSISFNQNIDCFIHTASPTSSLELQTKPASTINAIIKGTSDALSFAKNNNCKSFVFLSSIEVYGKYDDGLIKTVNENDLGFVPLNNPRSSYPEAKRLAELLCFSYFQEYGLSTKTARLTQTFGANLAVDDNRIFAQIARSVVDNRDIVLHTDGSFSRSYCYLTDAAKAIFLISTLGEPGETYNIANNNTYISVKDMAEMVCKHIANDRIKVVYDIADATKYGYANISSIKMSIEKLVSLGWVPEYSLEEMYSRLVSSLIYRTSS